jgi:hypothetical protein
MSVDIEFLSRQRLAAIFNIPVDQIRPDWIFGSDLKSSFRSDFARNEFDVVNDDIHDVADRNATRLLGEGRLAISTVGEYCEFMVNLSRNNFDVVKRVLTSITGLHGRPGL